MLIECYNLDCSLHLSHKENILVEDEYFPYCTKDYCIIDKVTKGFCPSCGGTDLTVDAGYVICITPGSCCWCQEIEE